DFPLMWGEILPILPAPELIIKRRDDFSLNVSLRELEPNLVAKKSRGINLEELGLKSLRRRGVGIGLFQSAPLMPNMPRYKPNHPPQGHGAFYTPTAAVAFAPVAMPLGIPLQNHVGA